MMTAVQGIVAAGTVAYLTREVTWERAALTANHLFYLAGIACHAASVEIPYFSLAAKVVFMMTPLFLIGNVAGKTDSPRAESCGFYFNRIYYAAAAVSTLVLVALGHTTYGAGFFSVMAVDLLSRNDKVHEYVKTVFRWGANAAALLSFASYGVKLATPQGQYLMGVTAAAVFLPKIWNIAKDLFPGSEGFPSNKKKRPTLQDDKYFKRFTTHAMYPVGLLSSASTGTRATGAFVQWVGGFTGPLPF